MLCGRLVETRHLPGPGRHVVSCRMSQLADGSSFLQFNVAITDSHAKKVQTQAGDLMYKSKKTHLGGAIDCQLSDAQAKTAETLLIKRGVLSNAVTFTTASGARLVTLTHPAFDPGQHDFEWMSTSYRWQTSAGSKRWMGKRLRIILTEMSTGQLIAEVTGDAGYADKIDTTITFFGRQDDRMWTRILVATALIAIKEERRNAKASPGFGP